MNVKLLNILTNMNLYADNGANTATGQLVDKLIGILGPILIVVAILVAFGCLAAYAIKGMLAKDSQERNETIKRLVWIFICCTFVVLASSIVLILKQDIIAKL